MIATSFLFVQAWAQGVILFELGANCGVRGREEMKLMQEAAITPKSVKIRTIARVLLGVAGAISCLIFFAVLFLWVRSYFIAEVICFEPVAAPEEFASPIPGKAGRGHYQLNLARSRGKVQAERRKVEIGCG